MPVRGQTGTRSCYTAEEFSQVGGGIATISAARAMLNEGAVRVIVGSALFHARVPEVEQSGSLVNTEFAAELAESVGAERVVCSVDTRQGRVAIKGWKEKVDLTPDQAMAALEPYCSAFLYTHIDTEGTMQGFPIDVARRLRQITQRQLIVAGGIRERAEIDALDQIHVDAVAGMAVYTGVLEA